MFEKSVFPKETKLCMWGGKSNKRALKEYQEVSKESGREILLISHQGKF